MEENQNLQTDKIISSLWLERWVSFDTAEKDSPEFAELTVGVALFLSWILAKHGYIHISTYFQVAIGVGSTSR